MSRLGDRPTGAGALKLRWGKYSIAYQRRLLEGGRSLHDFLNREDIDLHLLHRGKARVVDEILERFVRDKHSEDKQSSLRVAKHGVLWVQVLRPRLKQSLQSTWNTLKSWEEQKPAGLRPPMPLPLLCVLVCKARVLAQESGESKTRDAWMIFSALLLIGFFGLLRPGELLALRASDATLPNSLAVGCSFAVIRLTQPKNARQMGRMQFTELRHPDAINWLSWLKMRAPHDQSAFWPSTAARFRNMFKTVCSAVKIKELRLSPASLRAGGATLFVDQGVEINRVRLLGRWAHLRSLEHYVQIARAEQIALSIPPLIADQLKRFLCQFSFLLVLPKFLAAQVAQEHLVHAPVCTIEKPDHAVAEIRAWGRNRTPVQESSGGGWSFERS